MSYKVVVHAWITEATVQIPKTANPTWRISKTDYNIEEGGEVIPVRAYMKYEEFVDAHVIKQNNFLLLFNVMYLNYVSYFLLILTTFLM